MKDADTPASGMTKLQFIAIAVLVMICNVQVVNTYPNSRVNLWLSSIIGTAMAVPVLIMFARLSSLYPDDDIFTIVKKATGKFIGTVLGIIYIAYAIYLGALTLRCVTEFIMVVSMDETPRLIFLIVFSALSCFIVMKGPEIIGRMSMIVLPAVILIFVTIIIFSSDLYNFDYISPGIDENIISIADSAFSVASISFCDTFLLIMFMKHVKCGFKDKCTMSLKSLAVSSVMIFAMYFVSLLILGMTTFSKLYFPCYSAVSIINVGNFFTHIEIIEVVSVMMCVIMKECVCIYSAAEGIINVTGMKSDKLKRNIFLMLSAAGTVAVSTFLFGSTMKMLIFDWFNRYVALTLQIGLPFIIYSAAEIRSIAARAKAKKQGEMKS